MAITKDEILDGISALTVIELKELLDAFEERFGVTAAAPVAVAAAGGGAAAAAPVEEEKDEFDVILTGAGAQKIQVIKVVRELTSLGLKEAKDLVDAAPKPVLEKATKEAAEAARAKLADAGATRRSQVTRHSQRLSAHLRTSANVRENAELPSGGRRCEHGEERRSPRGRGASSRGARCGSRSSSRRWSSASSRSRRRTR